MAVDLVTLSGSPEHGDVFSARIMRPSAGDYVSGISTDNQAQIYVGFDAAGEIVISRQTTGGWDVLGRCAAPTGGVTLRIRFESDECLIGIAGQDIRVPATCRRIWRLIGQGDWHQPMMQLAGIEEAGRAVVRELPAEAIRDRTRQRDLVFDVGMHRGSDSAFYLAKGFRVVAIEANPMLCAAAARRFRNEIARGALNILNIGLGPERGRLPFYVNEENSEWSSFDRAIAARGRCSEITVQMCPMAEIVAAFGTPYYAKVDIEGYDRHAIIPLSEASDKPSCLSYENANQDIFETLVANGYRGFQLINQLHVEAMQCPQPSREGRTIDWRFEPGSSGPFGHDLPDEWLDASAMAERLAQYAVQRRADLAAGRLDWFDLHARLDEP